MTMPALCILVLDNGALQLLETHPRRPGFKFKVYRGFFSGPSGLMGYRFDSPAEAERIAVRDYHLALVAGKLLDSWGWEIVPDLDGVMPCIGTYTDPDYNKRLLQAGVQLCLRKFDLSVTLPPILERVKDQLARGVPLEKVTLLEV
jgi:hypothetical protein